MTYVDGVLAYLELAIVSSCKAINFLLCIYVSFLINVDNQPHLCRSSKFNFWSLDCIQTEQ